MSVYDYLLIALSLGLFPYINLIVLFTSVKLFKLHSETDLFGCARHDFLQMLDKKFKSRWVPPLSILIASFFAFYWINWSQLDSTLILRNFIFFLSCVVTWKAVTEDIDLATGEKKLKERVMMLGSLLGIWFYPGFLIPLVFIGIHHLKGWYHHQVMLWHIFQMFLSYLLALIIVHLAFIAFGQKDVALSRATTWFLFLCIIASHYAASGIKKLKFRNHWYAWAWQNRLHYLSASAYMWGWQRFRPEHKILKYLSWLKKWDRFVQFSTLAFECGWLVVGFDYFIAAILCTLGMCFHLIVFITSGIFFWQPIALLAATLAALSVLPFDTLTELFNWQNGLLLMGILVVFPLREKLWEISFLGWWDSPFIERVHWSVIGKSGKEYGLYNDFMSPHERFFGRHLGAFLIPWKILTRHLGELKHLPLRDAIVATGGNPEALHWLKDRYGEFKTDEHYERMHNDYLSQFFKHFNEGKPKKVCPALLKAPGGQYFYWGKLPSFHGQEQVAKVVLTYREDFYDEVSFRVIAERILKVIDIPNNKRDIKR